MSEREKITPRLVFKDEQIEKFKSLFPETFADGKIDFDALKHALGEFIEDDSVEHFGLTWPGKRDARKMAFIPPKGTLKLAKGEGINEDTTQNLYIEGDNLEVLKLLQKSYYNKIKMIYIDPPYNTGNDFVYKDDFSQTIEDYLKETGQLSEEGKALSTNPKTSGRFHSNWLNMIYPRLVLAKTLLREDGVIFVSIDDNEVHNLRAVMNEIFGEENYLTQFAWKTDGNFDNQAKVKKCHEYIIVFCKQLENFPNPPVIDPSIDTNSKLFNDEIRNTIVKNGPKNPISEVILPKGFPSDAKEGILEIRNDQWPHYLNKAIINNFQLQNDVTIKSGWSSKDLLLDFINNENKPILDNKG
ncbi:MAG TPA: site-specific DNA-methyltransferase [Spirochaetota bacterium]|nr:site-specific DNA-methyltransferase [Spirochaetota bacterium]